MITALICKYLACAERGDIWKLATPECRQNAHEATGRGFVPFITSKAISSWESWRSAAQVRQASLVAVAVPTGYDLYLFATLVLAFLLSFAVSHVLYLRAVRAKPECRRVPSPPIHELKHDSY